MLKLLATRQADNMREERHSKQKHCPVQGKVDSNGDSERSECKRAVFVKP